jgi:hypothetical protein
MHYPKCERNYKIFLEYEKTKNQNAININVDNINDNNSITLLEDNNDENNDDQQSMQNLIDSYLTSFPDSMTLIDQRKKHIESGNNINFSDNSKYKFGVRLLALLNRAKAPMYLFDELVSVMKDSFLNDNLKIDSLLFMSRKNSLDEIKKKYNYAGLQSQVSSYHCYTQKIPINVVWHDFGQCLYSLLTDEDLMQPENLLDDIDHSNEYNDITSGSVYVNYFNNKINCHNSEKLIPIIFFTDKTHTDVHGRLCLEPIQFTLGIFKRSIRNQTRAWRTLGYATESIYVYKKQLTSTQKQQDYHNILKIILNSFINYQKYPRVWEFKCADGEIRTKKMILPVLFIIGDTEGHDKLCGRYLCRNNIQRPCRYCDISFENSDKPDTTYTYTKVATIFNYIEKNNVEELKNISMWNVKNTMHLLDFCDPVRGIHGAVLAEVLHCLQLGIFQYSIEQLFLLKKLKRVKKKKKIQLLLVITILPLLIQMTRMMMMMMNLNLLQKLILIK